MRKALTELFKIYIFLLPFELCAFLSVLKGGTAATLENDLFIVLIGFSLMFLNGKIYVEKNSILFDSVKLLIVLMALSTITSILLYYPFGTLHGENTLTASLPSSIYLILSGIVFYYNATMFRIVPKEQIRKVLDLLCVFTIVLGYFQAIILLSGGIFSDIYDSLDIFGVLANSAWMLEMNRICLQGSEPAVVGEIIFVLLVPYMLGHILHDTQRSKKYKLMFLLIVPLAVLSYSSTVYVGLVVNCACMVYFILRKRMTYKKIRNLALIGMTFFLIAVLGGYFFFTQTKLGQTLYYLLLTKTTTNDLSTLVRMAPVYTDISAFLRFPISGVGNGNQGFFYNETVYAKIPSWAHIYFEFADKLSGKSGIVNGGPFVPAFISGYGIIGVVSLITFIKRCVVHIRTNAQEFGEFRYMYYIGGITFLVLGTVTLSFDGNFVAMFIASIPMMLKKEKVQKNEVGRI